MWDWEGWDRHRRGRTLLVCEQPTSAAVDSHQFPVLAFPFSQNLLEMVSHKAPRTLDLIGDEPFIRKRNQLLTWMGEITYQKLRQQTDGPTRTDRNIRGRKQLGPHIFRENGHTCADE